MPFAGGAQAEQEPPRSRVRPDWSGCHTIDGLKSAADSRAYSWVKYAPISIRRFSLRC